MHQNDLDVGISKCNVGYALYQFFFRMAQIFVIVPEKRDLNEATMKIEVYPFSSSFQ